MTSQVIDCFTASFHFLFYTFTKPYDMGPQLPDIEMVIADELQNFKEHGLPQLARSTDHWIASWGLSLFCWWGILLGAVAGYAIKKVMKIAVVIIGLFVAALAYLSYRGWVDVKWGTMEDASRTTLTSASEQVVHVLNNTATQFAAHPSAVASSGLPVAAMFGFVPGLLMGIRKG